MEDYPTITSESLKSQETPNLELFKPLNEEKINQLVEEIWQENFASDPEESCRKFGIKFSDSPYIPDDGLRERYYNLRNNDQATYKISKEKRIKHLIKNSFNQFNFGLDSLDKLYSVLNHLPKTFPQYSSDIKSLLQNVKSITLKDYLSAIKDNKLEFLQSIKSAVETLYTRLNLSHRLSQ
jgi:DNA-directed RNA polymerase subunit F